MPEKPSEVAMSAGEQKSLEYVNRINAGESKEEIFRDLPESFKSSVEEKLNEKPDVKNGLIGHPKTREYIDRVKAGENIELITQGLSDKMKEAVLIGISEDSKKQDLEAKKHKDEIRIQEIRADLKGLKSESGVESKEKNIESMNQDEFAEYLSQNFTEEDLRNGGIYQLLTIRPENRSVLMKDNREKSEELVQRRLNMLPDLKRWALESEAVVRKYSQGKGEGVLSTEGSGWQHYEINKGEVSKDEDRIKGYVSLKAEGLLEKFNSAIMSEIVDTLKSRGYHGQVKFPSAGGALYDRFDNIVIHGDSDIETRNALAVIDEILNQRQIEVVFTQTGKDGVDEKGEKTSHTDLLSQKVDKAAKQRLGLLK